MSSGAAQHQRVVFNGDAVSRRSLAHLPTQGHQVSFEGPQSVQDTCYGLAGMTPDLRMTRVHQEVEAV